MAFSFANVGKFLGFGGGSKDLKPEDMAPQEFVVDSDSKEGEGSAQVLRIVSWNINMKDHSAAAPEGWADKTDKFELIYQSIMQQNPHVVCLQEIPDDHCMNDRFEADGRWVYTESRHWSHSGQMRTFVLKDLPFSHLDAEVMGDKDGSGIPQSRFPITLLQNKTSDATSVSPPSAAAVAVSDTEAASSAEETKSDDPSAKGTTDGTDASDRALSETVKKTVEPSDDHSIPIPTQLPDLFIANVHLSPFGGPVASQKREAEFDGLVKLYSEMMMCSDSDSPSSSSVMIIVGDSNMREPEEESILRRYNNNTSDGTTDGADGADDGSGYVTPKSEDADELEEAKDKSPAVPGLLIDSCWSVVPDKDKQSGFYTCFKNFFDTAKNHRSRYDKLYFTPQSNGVSSKKKKWTVSVIKVAVFDKPCSEIGTHFLSDHRAVLVDLKFTS